MSSAPGFQGSTSRLLNLVKLMFNSDQIPSVITAEKIWRTGVFQIWRATSPAGWSQLQKVQQTIAPPRPNTLIKGAGRAWEPAVLTLECFLQLPLMSVWGSRSGLEPACLYPENSGKDSAGASLAGTSPAYSSRSGSFFPPFILSEVSTLASCPWTTPDASQGPAPAAPAPGTGQVSRADAFVPPKQLKWGWGMRLGEERRWRWVRGGERRFWNQRRFLPFTPFSDINAVTGNHVVPSNAMDIANGSSKAIQGACY